MIEAVPRSIAGVTTLQIVVVDDGSSDATRQLALDAGAHVISHGVSRGVGAAFHTALEHALATGADILVNIDGDGQFDAGEITRLVAPVVADEADFVTASRFADPALYPEMSRIKFVGNKMMSRLISFLTGKHFHDVSCGFRAYNRVAFLNLNLFGTFTYTQEDRPWLGIDAIFLNRRGLAQLLQVDREGGLLIQRVAPGGPADLAGLRGGSIPALLGDQEILLGGDLILEFNTQEACHDRCLIQEGTRLSGLDRIPIRFLRGGVERQVSVPPARAAVSPSRLNEPSTNCSARMPQFELAAMPSSS